MIRLLKKAMQLICLALMLVVLMAVVFLCTRRKGNGMEE